MRSQLRKIRFVFLALAIILSACELELPGRGEILCSGSSLATAIRRANANPDHSIIQLPASCEIVLTEVNNSTTIGEGRGGNGLPVISSPITIRGSGSSIRRADATGTPEFRIFYIDGAAGGDLNLEGIAVMNGSARNGGGVYVADGVLRLTGGAEISGNNATGSGGGVYCWNAILETSGVGSAFISNNQAGAQGGRRVRD